MSRTEGIAQARAVALDALAVRPEPTQVGGVRAEAYPPESCARALSPRTATASTAAAIPFFIVLRSCRRGGQVAARSGSFLKGRAVPAALLFARCGGGAASIPKAWRWTPPSAGGLPIFETFGPEAAATTVPCVRSTAPSTPCTWRTSCRRPRSTIRVCHWRSVASQATRTGADAGGRRGRPGRSVRTTEGFRGGIRPAEGRFPGPHHAPPGGL